MGSVSTWTSTAGAGPSAGRTSNIVKSAASLALLGSIAAGAATDPRISDVRLSPDGNRVVAIQTTGRERIAVVADFVTGRRMIAASQFPPGGRLDACDWVSNERLVCSLFIFRNRTTFRKPFGDERLRLVRLFAVDYDGGNPRALLDRPLRSPPKGGGTRPSTLSSPASDPEHALVSRLPGDSSRVLVSASREAKPYASVYRVDVESDGLPELLVGWQKGIQLWHADWQGRVRVGTGACAYGDDSPWKDIDEPPIGPAAVAGNSAGEARMRRLDIARLTSTIGPTETAGPRVLGFSMDGSTVYYSGRVDGADFASVWEADAGTLEPVREVVSDSERDVSATAIGGEGCGTVGFAQGRDIAWLDPVFEKAVAKVAGELGARVAHVPSMSANCRRLVLASTDRTAVRFYLLDLDTGALRNLGGHRARGGAGVRTVRREDRFPTRDGQELPIALTLPGQAGDAALPIVVLLRYEDGWSSDPAMLDDYPHAFASQGYVVAQPAFRGSQGYGEARLLAGLDQRGLKIQEDVADAVDWLASEGIGDAQRVCFAGRGRGGHMAMVAALGYEPPVPAEARRCLAALAALEVRQTKRAPHNVLDARVLCSFFPCGDWLRWAAPDAMRLAAIRFSAAKPDRRSRFRSPVVGAAHPGFPVLVHVDGRTTVHRRRSMRYVEDVKRISFFQHVAFAGGETGAAFLHDAGALFAEVLGGATHLSGNQP